MFEQVINRNQWEEFFNRLTQELDGAQTEIEVASLRIGDQIQARWVPLLGVSYDPKDDIVEIAVQGLDHMVREPTTLTVQWNGAKAESLAVDTRAGDRHIIKFQQPLRLPAPRAGDS